MSLKEKCERLYDELHELAFPKVAGPELLENFSRELLDELHKRLDSKLSMRDAVHYRENIRWSEIEDVLREYADFLDMEGASTSRAEGSKE